MARTDPKWKVFGAVTDGHVTVYRATSGRVGHHVPGLPPMLLLDHVGAKSGTARTTPLSYLIDGDDVVIVASKGGDPKHPSWYHNLLANPDATIQIGPERRAVRARTATPEERERLWPEVVAMYEGYAGYQRRTEREIPLVILEPRAEDPAEPLPGERLVGPASELPVGKVTGAGGWAVGHGPDGYFAVSRRCRHLFADLAGGRVDRKDGGLVCPWHGAKYDVRTGRMVRGPQAGFEKIPGLDAGYEALTRVVPLRRGQVVERDGMLFVRERSSDPQE
jgi:deazaflavin-dependent oxidoreductase (nitroreductase family)